MSFLVPCPVCGPRDVYEFRYGGEVKNRPAPGSDAAIWADYLYFKANAAGPERAWWFHGQGCRRWFQAERNTRDNHVTGSFLPAAHAPGALSPPPQGRPERKDG